MKHLLDFCRTDRQKEIINKVLHKGNITHAAKELGINRRNVQLTIGRVKKYAASQGIDPEANLTKKTAHGFATKRVSTNYGAEGEVKQQWHIQEPDKAAKLEALFDVLESYQYKPAPKIKPKEHHDGDLCTLYTPSYRNRR
jgi:molybdenum-dependent DNA-binding transcriptional regulator ModE